MNISLLVILTLGLAYIPTMLLLRTRIYREQVEYVEPTEHSTFWLEKRS